jgi:lipopolysaccharide/colanic/teichoic acid biosynthesis glycosyltransferase
MALARWLRKFHVKLRTKKHSSSGFYLDEKSFRYELERERARVDRNRSPLAVLTIKLPSDRAKAQDFDFLGRLLARRLRITDTIGFLPEQRVGVLLPDTPKSGAWKVASDICSVYPVGHDRPDCEVYVYPSDVPQRHEEPDQREQKVIEEGAPASIDALMSQPMPIWKRTSDVVGAIVGLIVSAPLLLICAAAIKLTSRGPVFYFQEREGIGGRRFVMYKLRTMVENAELLQPALQDFNSQDGPAFKMEDDPRATWVGRWLRWASLDELPQLWNVLRGEMSLVGPRPLPTLESLQCLPWHRQRLSVVPGMTCFWQVYARNTVSFDQWMRMDIQYVRRRSALCDLRLLLWTAPAIVFSRGPR